jgi:hypothetical protein
MAIATLSRKSGQSGVDLTFIANSLRFPWVTLVLVTGLTIAALLAGRLWLQMSEASGTTTSGASGILLSVTETLVSPYRGQDQEPLASSNAIFEFATLLALKAYLVATLAIVLIIVAARVIVLAVTVATHDAEARVPAHKRAIFTLQPIGVAASSTPAAAAATSANGGTGAGEDSQL